MSRPSWHFAFTAPKHSKQARPRVIFSMQTTSAPSSAAFRLAMSPPMPAPTTTMSWSSVAVMLSAGMASASKAMGPRGPGQATFWTGIQAVSFASSAMAGTAPSASSATAVTAPALPARARAPAATPMAPAPRRKSRRDTFVPSIVPPSHPIRNTNRSTWCAAIHYTGFTS